MKRVNDGERTHLLRIEGYPAVVQADQVHPLTGRCTSATENVVRIQQKAPNLIFLDFGWSQILL